MKRPQNMAIVTVKNGKVFRKKRALRSAAIRHHRNAASTAREEGYSDGLVRVYRQEEKDINRFAAFAKTLMSR